MAKIENKKLEKEAKENNKKILELQKKLGIKNNKLKSGKPSNDVQNMIEECLAAKNEQYKELEKIPEKIIEKMDKIARKIIEFKLKKMHNFEKKLEKMKIQLKPEEKEFFMNYPKFCNDIGRRINAFSNQIHCETKKLFEDIHKAKAAQKDIICPLRKKLAEKEKTIKENSTKKD
jgi:hypothetical protein